MNNPTGEGGEEGENRYQKKEKRNGREMYVCGGERLPSARPLRFIRKTLGGKSYTGDMYQHSKIW